MSFPALSEATKKKSLAAIRLHAASLPPLHLDVPVTPAEVERMSASLDTFCEKMAQSTSGGGGDDGVLFLTPSILRDPASILNAEGLQLTFPITPFPVFDSNKMPPKPSAAVRMRHKQSWAASKQKLPVYNNRSAILTAVRNAKVTTVVAGKHTGKSTQTPQLLFETDLYKKKRILVVCGSDLAATNLAERLRDEIGLDEGHVAHCITGDIRCCAGTQLVVTTPIIFCKQLVCDPFLVDVGAVVLDDTASRSIYLDFSLALLRELLASHAQLLSLGAQGLQRLPDHLRTAVASLDKLTVVILCHDDLTESQIAKYFQQQSSSFGELGEAAASAAISIAREVVPDAPETGGEGYSISPVLLVDDAIAWLKRCETSATSGTLPKIPVEVATELTAVYSDDLHCLTQVQLADEAAVDMSVQSDKLSFWWNLCAKIIQQFHAATSASDASALSEALIILPSAAH